MERINKYEDWKTEELKERLSYFKWKQQDPSMNKEWREELIEEIETELKERKDK